MGVWSLNKMEMDAIGEIMSISMGASASAVSSMLGKTVTIAAPTVTVQTKEELEFKDLEPAVSVDMDYIEGLEGKSIFVFRRSDLGLFVGMMKGQENAQKEFVLDEATASMVCEVVNQMMGAAAASLSEFLRKTVRMSQPRPVEVQEENVWKERHFANGDSQVIVRFILEIEGKIKSEFLNIMSIELAKRIIEPFAGDLNVSGEPVEDFPLQEEPQATVPNPAVQNQTTPPYESGYAQSTAQSQPSYGQGAGMAADPVMQQLLMQMQQTQQQMMAMMNQNQANQTKQSEPKEEGSLIRPLSPGQLEEQESRGEEDKANKEMLMQVPLEVSVEIGRTKKLVRDILEFTQGSLVVLDKMAGEQVDLFVNGQCIAKGDIVVVEDNFGIRITEIVSRNVKSENL